MLLLSLLSTTITIIIIATFCSANDGVVISFVSSYSTDNVFYYFNHNNNNNNNILGSKIRVHQQQQQQLLYYSNNNKNNDHDKHHHRFFVAAKNENHHSLLFKMRGGYIITTNSSTSSRHRGKFYKPKQKSVRSLLLLSSIHNSKNTNENDFGNKNNNSKNDNDKKNDSLVKTKQQKQQQHSQQKQQKSIIIQKGISLSLSLTYLTVMGAKCALPSVLSLLQSNEIGLTYPKLSASYNHQYYMSKLLTLSTIAIVFGKIVLGPIIDTIGGIQSLQYALIGLVINLLIITYNQSFVIFSIAWIFIDFIFSSCWAACIHSIHQIYSSTNNKGNINTNHQESNNNNNNQEYTKQISYIAASARIGNALAFTLFGQLLYYFEKKQTIKQYWRPIFFVSALSQFIPLGMLFYYGRKLNQQEQEEEQQQQHQQQQQQQTTISINNQLENKSEKTTTATSHVGNKLRTSLITLQKEAFHNIEFWLHLISRSVLMVYASFLLFIPTLLMDIYNASSSTAAKVGSFYALGCFVAVTAGTSLYNKITTTIPQTNNISTTATVNNKNNKIPRLIAFTIMLLLGATGSSIAQLGHMMELWTLSIPTCSILFFIWGLSFSIPFYIPPSLYALERGGNASATIADVFDIGGFALLALFNGYVASIANKTIRSSWIRTFQITTACSLISYIALSITVVLDNNHKNNNNSTQKTKKE